MREVKNALRKGFLQIVNVHPTPMLLIRGTTTALLPAAKAYCTMYLPLMTSDLFSGKTSVEVNFSMEGFRRWPQHSPLLHRRFEIKLRDSQTNRGNAIGYYYRMRDYAVAPGAAICSGLWRSILIRGPFSLVRIKKFESAVGPVLWTNPFATYKLTNEPHQPSFFRFFPDTYDIESQDDLEFYCLTILHVLAVKPGRPPRKDKGLHFGGYPCARGLALMPSSKELETYRRIGYFEDEWTPYHRTWWHMQEYKTIKII